MLLLFSAEVLTGLLWAAFPSNFQQALKRMRSYPMAGWSAVRWPEWSHIAHYILDTVRGLSADDRQMLLEIAQLAQRQGFDWVAYYTDTSVSPSFMVDGVPFARGWTLTEARGGYLICCALHLLSVPRFRTLHGAGCAAFAERVLLSSCGMFSLWLPVQRFAAGWVTVRRSGNTLNTRKRAAYPTPPRTGACAPLHLSKIRSTA